jgi:hypothetical protein
VEELKFLADRIFSKDEAIREAVSSDDIRRYFVLTERRKAKESEREQILAELRQAAQGNDPASRRRQRGVDLISRGLQRR